MRENNQEATAVGQGSQLHRRRFLMLAGLAGASLMIPSCKKDDDNDHDPTQPGVNNDGSINLGSGDIGVLNYAYALEQLESNFYERVMQSPYSGMTSADRDALSDIRDIEVTHREFYKKALASNAIPALTFDFSAINFNDRTAVLMAARNFEDVGVSAYNGAGRLLTDVNNLATAGKIASVEGRNGSVLRYIMGEAFYAPSADNPVIIDANGLDLTRKPTEVLPIAGKFIKQTIDATHLPTY